LKETTCWVERTIQMVNYRLISLALTVLLAIMNEQAGSFSAALAEGFHEAVMDSGSDQLIDIYQRRLRPAIQCIPPTPSTDAFLAEVRAQGVEMFAASLGSPYVERGEECYQDGYTHAIERIKCHKAAEFAAQIRKGGATEEKQSFLSDEDCQAFVKAFTKGAAQ
ncbi:hypothetical protein P2S52_17545, partial [Escherichia coli]